jgi:phage-related protein
MKPLHWIASSKKDYLSLPEEVQDEMGFALFIVQTGDKPANAKPLKGCGGATVF